jgi:uncharacterized membrane protein HdeD (DUF308 family)
MTDPLSLDAAAEARGAAMRQSVRRNATLFLLQGVLLVAAGVLALVYPLVSTVMVALVLGWILIFAGIAQAVTLIGGAKVPHFWLQLISAVLSVVVGFLVVRNPAVGVGALVLLMVVYFLIGGVAKIVFSLAIRPIENWGWVLASGIVALLIGLWLVANPGLSLLFLGIFVGVNLIAEGAAIAWLAWQVRRLSALPPAATA